MNLNTLEFLNRISFFSILSWSFFLVAAICALILTNLKAPLIRKYRSTLISVALSSLVLGSVGSVTPFFLRKLNPDQSRLTAIDQLPLTQWVEPISNPEVALKEEDETAWLKNTTFRFKYKLEFSPFQFQHVVRIHENNIVILDQKGVLRGFNAYSAINHWSIDLQIHKMLSSLQVGSKFFILDRMQSLDVLRLTCVDLQNPSVLWQRIIPNSKEGELSYNSEAQSILVTTGTTGIWALLAKNGAIIWKRPEIYTKTKALVSQKHLLVFEPVVANRSGAWYKLDLVTGKTLQKIPHVYPEIASFTPLPSENLVSDSFLAEVNASQFFLMKHTDATKVWSFNVNEPVNQALMINPENYFVFYESKMLEMRKLSNNDLLWQKKMSDVKPAWMKFTLEHQLLTLPTEATDGNAGVSFYELQTGNYLFSAKVSEPIIDMEFYGDWFYLFSESHVWAFQSEARKR